MSFLYPQFLWALFALTIPVIIHFFNFRRYKTVYFSNTRFLRQVEKKSTSINRLRNYLVLLSRLLALAFLVMAFAQPYLPVSDSEVGNSRYLSIYVDNSLSMKATGVNGVLLDEAREKAVEIVEALPEGYQVQVITNDFSGKQQRYYSKREAVNLLDEITASYSYRNFEEVLERAKGPWQKLEETDKGRLQLFAISDFQSSQFDKLELEDGDIESQFVVLQHLDDKSNLAIDSVWFDRPALQPGFDMELYASIQNYGEEKMENIPLQLKVENQLVDARQIEIAPQGNEIVKFNFRFDERKHYRGELNLDAGRPTFDNDFYFSFSLNDPIPVSLIGEKNAAIEKLLNDSLYAFSQIEETAIDYGKLSGNQLVIINSPQIAPSGLASALLGNLEDGNNVVLIPSLKNLETFKELLLALGTPLSGSITESKSKATNLRWDDPIFKGVFTEKPSNPSLPVVNAYFKTNSPQAFNLLELENGDPLVMRIPKANGNLIVFTSAFDREISNLAQHPVSVPILLNAALYAGHNNPLYTQAGSKTLQSFTTNSQGDEPLKILKGEEVIIPQQRSKGKEINLYGIPSQLEKGFYPAQQSNNLLGYLAVNIDSRESNWNFLSEKQLQETNNNILMADAGSLSQDIKDIYQGVALWKWFLLAALLFLLIEMVLLKFLR